MVNDTDSTIYLPASVVKVDTAGFERISDYLLPGERTVDTGRDDAPPPPPPPRPGGQAGRRSGVRQTRAWGGFGRVYRSC